MRFLHEIKCSTLDDSKETRGWRIHAEFSQCVNVQARKRYIADSIVIEVENTAALDSTTIDLSLSLFPLVLFRTTKSAEKMRTLLNLRGYIPSFFHISNGRTSDVKVKVLDVLALKPGAFNIMGCGYLDFGRLCLMHQAPDFFVTRAKSNTQFRGVYAAPVDRCTGIICDQSSAHNAMVSLRDYPVHLRRIRFKDPRTGKTLVFLRATSRRWQPRSARCTKRAGR